MLAFNPWQEPRWPVCGRTLRCTSSVTLQQRSREAERLHGTMQARRSRIAWQVESVKRAGAEQENQHLRSQARAAPGQLCWAIASVEGP
jgi:hypothetical protein